MRRVCEPVVLNCTVLVCCSQYALSCQPQPETPQPLQFSRFSSSPRVDPIG